jgi:hypothetical protein
MHGSDKPNRDPRLDDYQSDTRYCQDCCRQRAFVNGQCVACVARGHALASGLIAHAVRNDERMKTEAFHDFCRLVER